MAIDQRMGSAELKRLSEVLRPPCRLGEFVLEGLMARTSTALIFIARDRDGAECVLKLTGPTYMPVLERELRLLNRCQAGRIQGVVRPLCDTLLPIDDAIPESPLGAIVLPFLAGGDLVQWIGTRATRTGVLGAAPALEVGLVLAGRLRGLLRMSPPIVHGDVKVQNVLLPRPDAPLSELTLIDFDAADELDAPVVRASRESAQRLVADVNGFGEVLYMVATGREPPADEDPNPSTGNAAFDRLVVRCITAEPGERGYASLAGDALWRDLQAANAAERSRHQCAVTRPVLAMMGLLVLAVLIVALVSKVAG